MAGRQRLTSSCGWLSRPPVQSHWTECRGQTLGSIRCIDEMLARRGQRASVRAGWHALLRVPRRQPEGWRLLLYLRRTRQPTLTLRPSPGRPKAAGSRTPGERMPQVKEETPAGAPAGGGGHGGIRSPGGLDLTRPLNSSCRHAANPMSATTGPMNAGHCTRCDSWQLGINHDRSNFAEAWRCPGRATSQYASPVRRARSCGSLRAEPCPGRFR